jgi:hypothetical protein
VLGGGNAASRRQANRLSIRQLSSFLRHTMKKTPCVNLHNIQLKPQTAVVEPAGGVSTSLLISRTADLVHSAATALVGTPI